MRGLLAPLIKLITFLTITGLATYVLAATIANSAYGDTVGYKAAFTDVTGLNLGDDVRIAGVRVGAVTGISIEKRASGSIALVGFTVQKSRTLPRSVTAHLRYRNLVGQRYIDIEQGAGNPNDLLKSGETIPQEQTFDAVDLTVLFQGFKPLVQGLDPGDVNKLSLDVIRTLQGEGGALQSLLATVADLTNALADKDAVIGDLVDNLTGVLSAIGDRDDELKQLVVQLAGFVHGLAGDRHTIGDAIDGINRLSTSTAGLLTEVRAPLAKDVKDVTGLVSTLNRHSDTVRYVVRQLPPTIAALTRTASYGSWFNFYLCSLSGTLTIAGHTTELDLLHPTVARCR